MTNLPLPVPDALTAKWHTSTEPFGDGHLRWTGPRYIGWGDRQHGPRVVAYAIHNGRLPVGRVEPECGQRGCILPAHLEDAPGRYHTRLNYRALLGLPQPPARCRRDHDQAIHGRLNADGIPYCAQCHDGYICGDPLKLIGPARDQTARNLRARYDAGASIADLITETGRSYGYVHALLDHAGTAFRPRGGRAR